MTTEIFQWATVILLAFILLKPASSQALQAELVELRSILQQIRWAIEQERGLLEQVSMIGSDVSDLQERLREHYPTEKEIERIRSNNP